MGNKQMDPASIAVKGIHMSRIAAFAHIEDHGISVTVATTTIVAWSNTETTTGVTTIWNTAATQFKDFLQGGRTTSNQI